MGGGIDHWGSGAHPYGELGPPPPLVPAYPQAFDGAGSGYRTPQSPLRGGGGGGGGGGGAAMHDDQARIFSEFNARVMARRPTPT